MRTSDPLLKNLSSQVVFEAYARLTAEQAQLAQYDHRAFDEALEASVLRVLEDQRAAATPSIS
jgi:hypothetical protein